MNSTLSANEPVSNIERIQGQRSHVLISLSDAVEGHDRKFRGWYETTLCGAVKERTDVLRARHYTKHDIDITEGRCLALPLKFLAIYDICIDGAGEARDFIDWLTQAHADVGLSRPPATWLFYPMNEPVGHSPTMSPPMVTIAFANAVKGQEQEFREWYATRHIRHALNVPALANGQCFERTLFQNEGALALDYSMIAIYEQAGSAEAILEAFHTVPLEKFAFPALDPVRFTESVYQQIA